MATDFPTTVREFWRLLSNKSALTRLANHYSVAGWDRWKRATSGDTDVTCYTELEDAVTAHPDKCLRALAMSWGLQQTALERLGLQREVRLRGKRKADTDNGSRRVRAREDQNSSSASESTSSQDINDQRSPQDIDDQRSQHSRVISVQIRVSSNAERRDLVERLMAAAEERGHQEYREPSEHTRLGWKVGSSTPSERWVRRIGTMGQTSSHASELQGRHREHSSRERSPREELN